MNEESKRQLIDSSREAAESVGNNRAREENSADVAQSADNSVAQRPGRGVGRAAKFQHEGLKVTSALPVTTNKAFTLFVDQVIKRGQSEMAKVQNSQTVLDASHCQYLKYGSAKRLTIILQQKLPEISFPCTALGSCPVNQEQDYFYFETLIKAMHLKKLTLVGFSSRKTTSAKFAPANQLGAQTASYGLRSDGLLFKEGVSKGDRFRPKNAPSFTGFEEGDVVGCGLDLVKRSIFFTLNGVYLGEAFTDVLVNGHQVGKSTKGQSNRLIAAIEKKPLLSKQSDAGAGAGKHTSLLYAAVCLQMTGDSVRCNFGAKPFGFDVDAHFLNKRYTEQFLRVREKPVKLTTMYTLVHQYLETMAYSETLAVFEAEQGVDASEKSSPLRRADEETKVIQRKMTIDYGSNEKTAEADNTIGGVGEGQLSERTKELGASQDAESKSQLTVETEKMVPLPSADLLNNQQSSSMLSSQQKEVLVGNQEDTVAAEYIKDLFKQTQEPQRSAVVTLRDLSAVDDDGQSLQNRLIVLSRSKSTCVTQALFSDGLLPEEDLLLATQNFAQGKRSKLRKLLQEGAIEEASLLLEEISASGSGAMKDCREAKLCIAAIACVNSICAQDIAAALKILQAPLFKAVGATIPIWSSKTHSVQRRPVQTLAGLLCYTDPQEQTVGLEINDLISQHTKKVLIDQAIMATDMLCKPSQSSSSESSKTTRLGQMLKQLEAARYMLVEARQN